MAIAKTLHYEQSGDETVHYSKRQAIRNATKWDDIPTLEVFRRLYHRHDTVIWEALFVISWLLIIWSKVKNW